MSDQFIASAGGLDLEMFTVNTIFFLPAAATDHGPSTAALSSAVYNGKESPKQQLVKNSTSVLSRPSVLGIYACVI